MRDGSKRGGVGGGEEGRTRVIEGWFTSLCTIACTCIVIDPSGVYENRTVFESLEIGWTLLRIFPKEMLVVALIIFGTVN